MPTSSTLLGLRTSRPDTASSSGGSSYTYSNPSPISPTLSTGSWQSSYGHRPSLPSPVSPVIVHSNYHNPWRTSSDSPQIHEAHQLPAYNDGLQSPDHFDPYPARIEPQTAPPPTYVEARVPIDTVIYQFSSLPNGAHILIPPRNFPDTRPVYHIRTFQNTFSPSAHRTVVRRGGGDDGEFVGEFEFGMSSNKSYVHIHGKADHLPKILHKTKKAGHISHAIQGHWIWALPTDPPVCLYWDCSHRTAWTCSIPRNTVLAKYNPPDISPTRGMVMPTLQVTPAGQKYFDEILIAALILEQKAALPMFKEGNEYRSYYSF